MPHSHEHRSQITAQHSTIKGEQLGGVIRHATWVGLVVNVVLTIAKFLAGWLGGSKALVADAVHSLSDLTTDFAVIIGSHFWLKPPDEDHPYGHGRLETLVTLGIGGVLAMVGIFMTLDAIEILRVGEFNKPSWIAAVMAAFSIVSKEVLYRWTLVQSRNARSTALAANAWHHRSDAISSIPVLVTVLATIVMPEWGFLDAVGAVVVSGFILKASIDIIRPGLSELLDSGVPPEVAKRIRDVALNTKGVLDVHDLRTRLVSGNIQADLHVVLPPTMTILEGHQIVEQVMQNMTEQLPDVADVLIHIDPWDDSTAPDQNKNYPPPKSTRFSHG